MNIKIESKQKNQALNREEIEFEIKDAKVTPKIKEVREKIAGLVGTKPDLIIIEKIGTRFGSTLIAGKALAYSDQKDLEAAERKHMITRNTGVKKQAEAKQEAPKPEAKKEQETKKEETEDKKQEKSKAPEEKETPKQEKEEK